MAAWSYHLRTVVSDDIVVSPMPLSSPPSRIQKRSLTITQAKNAVTSKADDTTQPASGQHPNWVPNATTRGLGTLLPGLSPTYYIFDGGVRTNMITSIVPKGTQNKSRKDEAKEKTR